jgi:hypothetical protein
MEEVYFTLTAPVRIAGPSVPIRVYVATSVRYPCYVYGSDLKHNRGGLAITKGKLERHTTMGSQCKGAAKMKKSAVESIIIDR